MYENAQYMVTPGTEVLSVIRVSMDGATLFVPLDPANTDYQNIMQLVAEGQLVIQPADGAK